MSGQELAAPPPLEIEALLRTLARHGVEYVLIGGIAARLHGSPLLTEDLDITPATTRENLKRLASALRELEAKLRVRPGEAVAFEIDERMLAVATILTLTTKHGFLDICVEPEGTRGYVDLASQAESYDVLGVRVQVATLADIIRSKQAAGRNKDLQALPTLRMLERRLQR